MDEQHCVYTGWHKTRIDANESVTVDDG